MADFSLTFLDLQKAAAHAVGLTVTQFDVNDGMTAAKVVNQALVRHWTRRRWRWRNASETLSLTQSQSYVALSATYGRTISLAGYAGSNYTVCLVDLEQLNQLRESSDGTGQEIYAAVSWTAQAAVTSAPVARLEIFPTPAATASNVMTHVYAKRIPALSGNTDVPDCPPHHASALESLVRHIARERVLGPGEGAADLAMYQAELRGLIDEDVMSQPFGTSVPGTNLQLGGGEAVDERRRYEPSGVTFSS